MSSLLCYTEVRSAFSIEQSFNAAEKPTNLVEVNSKGEATSKFCKWAWLAVGVYLFSKRSYFVLDRATYFSGPEAPTTALLSCPQDVVVSVPDSHAWRESGIFGIS